MGYKLRRIRQRGSVSRSDWSDGTSKLDSSRLRGQTENKKGVYAWFRACGRPELSWKATGGT